MVRSRPLVLALAVAALTLHHAGLAVAQDPQPAPAAPAAAPAAPAVDSNALWEGDWDFTAQANDSQMDGVWRINDANGRFTGVVAIPGHPPAPISAMTVRDHYRNFSLTAYFNGESYVFSGRLDNPRTVSGTMTIRGGIGRMRAQKRG
jgi:hypothetical protein